jgi:outer membrane protein
VRARLAMLLITLAPAVCLAQTGANLQTPAITPLGSRVGPSTTGGTSQMSPSVPNAPQPQGMAGQMLTLKDAEASALKRNPLISVARLNALAAEQVTRETRSSLWPTATVDLTGVDAQSGSRITAGGLNNPVIYERAADGARVSQLITDFGHTTNLAASAAYQAKAENQNALATKEQILLAVHQAFYNALQSRAVLKVAEQTVSARQTSVDQVSALAKNKLKSDLDLSFANVNLAQAKLLLLDAQANNQAAMATLSAVLGFPDAQSFKLVQDSAPLSPPPLDAEPLIAQAFSTRPEILSLQFQSQSAEKLHLAERDQLFPTISALGAVGNTPFGNSRLSGWYGAVGVDVQIPVFNGFLYRARSHETELRAQAAKQRIEDMRNSIARDVRTSWLDATRAYDRISVSQQLLSQANLALDLAQTRYKLGLGSIVELSQAELQQTQAAIGSTEAEYDYRLSLSVLRFQTTGL